MLARDLTGIKVGMKEKLRLLFFPIVYLNETASQMRKKCRVGLDFVHLGIDWIGVIYYCCCWREEVIVAPRASEHRNREI